MPLPLILALAIFQSGAAQTPATQQPAQTTGVTAPAQQTALQTAALAPTSFSDPYTIVEPIRLALTPTIDGTIGDEEWDMVGTAGPSGKAFFQWAPGVLYFAGIVPDGHDLLASFDLHANGWLIGSDNVEVRVSYNNGQPTMTARLLDATRVSGPAWGPLPGFARASSLVAMSKDGMTTYEVAFCDPGVGLLPEKPGTTLSLRFDAPMSTEEPFAPFIPRNLTPVRLEFHRAAALPSGLTWGAEGEGKNVVPGETVRIRFTFNGSPNMHLMKLALQGEGSIKELSNKLEVPFPTFDGHGRAFVDYDTGISGGASLGYRIVRGMLTTADGITSEVEASFRVAPIIDLDLVRAPVLSKASDRSVRFGYYIRSNTGKHVVGELAVSVPAPLHVLNADVEKIDLSSHQDERLSFEVYVPANTAGTYAVTFAGMLNGQKISETRFFTIGGL
jgi:hypothetical protein